MNRRSFAVSSALAMLTLYAGCTRSRESAGPLVQRSNKAATMRSLHPLHTAIKRAEARTGKVAVHSQSGVAFIDITVGEGVTPQVSDQIVAHYVGWLPDGTKFESSFDRGKPGTFGVSDVVAGCTEGLLTMRVGGKRKLFVPAHLAYGSNGRPGLIPPDSPLIYEFELLAIK